MAEDSGNSFLWFLAGLGLGAVVGVLYAPKSGRETRDEIFQRAEEGRDYVVNRARQAREQAQQWADKGRELYQQQKDQFKSAFEAGKDAYREATGEPGPRTAGPES
jgi:gas vesicle protein